MKTLQIRNVPDEVHRALKARAAKEGRSLSEYALAELRRSVAQPSHEELFERIRARGRVDTPLDTVEVLREGREARTDHLDALTRGGRGRRGRR